MNEPTTAGAHTNPSALRALFLRYLSGQISQISWDELMRTFDADETTPEEREAFARFYSDALLDFGPDAVRIPKQEELAELLTATRHS